MGNLEAREAEYVPPAGTGKTTAWLAAQVAPGRVTALDFAPEVIAKARAKGVDADFACMDVCSDDLGCGRYDVILCFHSFPHFRTQAAALRNFARALTPTGRLIVMHLASSDHINHFHAGIDGPVKGDSLPLQRSFVSRASRPRVARASCPRTCAFSAAETAAPRAGKMPATQ